MKLKYIGMYEYSETKKFKKYEDEFNNVYIEKSTSIDNYSILRQISDIAQSSDHLHGINGFYKKDENTINYFISLLEGTTLEQVMLGKKAYSENQIKQFIYQICLGLKELHINNILHRDIKPANIMIIKESKIVLIDYDISREVKLDQTNDTTASGTRGFSSPEQYGFMQTDQRSDIYSLGKTIESLVEQCCSDQYFNFKHIIDNCTQIDPNNRFTSVDEIIEIVSKEYPTFFDEQLCQIEQGKNLGFSEEELNLYANAKFNSMQMGVIKHALDENVDLEVIKLLSDEVFSSKQMWQIKRGSLDGIKLTNIKKYAKPFYNPIEMSIYRTGLLKHKSTKDINNMQKLYIDIITNNIFSDEQLGKIRYAIYHTYDNNFVKEIACEINEIDVMDLKIKEYKRSNNEWKHEKICKTFSKKRT
ncbi:MAG: protein kinase domain-containing protein [Mycoplasmatales bacterium]